MRSEVYCSWVCLCVCLSVCLLTFYTIPLCLILKNSGNFLFTCRDGTPLEEVAGGLRRRNTQALTQEASETGYSANSSGTRPPKTPTSWQASA